jgi:hypothetical protein
MVHAPCTDPKKKQAYYAGSNCYFPSYLQRSKNCEEIFPDQGIMINSDDTESPGEAKNRE